MPFHFRQPMLSVSGPERHVRGSPMVGVIGRETPRRERREVYAAPTRVWKTRLHCFDCNRIIQDGVCVRNHTQTHIHTSTSHTNFCCFRKGLAGLHAALRCADAF